MKWERAGTEALCYLALHLFHPQILSCLQGFTVTCLHFLCSAHQFKHVPLRVCFLTFILYQNKERVEQFNSVIGMIMQHKCVISTDAHEQ